MASGKWERVGKKGKPFNKHRGEQNNTKDSDKPLDGSQFQLTDVVKISQTKFSSFSDDHAKSAAPPTPAAAAAGNRTSRAEGKKQSVDKKKAHSDNNKEPRPSTISLKDAMDQLNAKDIKEFIEQAKEQYPDDSLAWFKELIGYFRQHLPNVDVLKESDNIVSMVPMETRKILIGCFKALPEKTLRLFFIHTLNDVTTLSPKGANVVGVLLLAELLKLSHPSIVDKCADTAQKMLQPCISRPQESLPLLRAILLQQQHNTDHGIKAWCKVLLPLMINTDNVPRQVITFAVNYSFELFSALFHPPALPLTAAEFVCTLQTAPPTQVAGDQAMVKKFYELMLSISRCVVTLSNGKPAECFQQLLWTLEKHNEPHPPQQLLQSAVLCVSHDVQCQKVWNNHRHGNQANRLLIQYMVKHWEEVKNYAVHNKCIDGLLAVLRSPHMVAVTKMVTKMGDAPWNEPVKGVHDVPATSSHVINKLMMLVVLFVFLLLLGNHLCHHSNNNIVCAYIENVMVSIKWVYHYIVPLATSLQNWLLLNVPYWDAVSSVGYQVIIGIVQVYRAAWEMTSALWQLLQHCCSYIQSQTIVMK